MYCGKPVKNDLDVLRKGVHVLIGTPGRIYDLLHRHAIDGSNIKIMLGSPSIKEGVSLLRVEQIHILEPYWNLSRMYQIIGRGIRFCSHKDVPKEKQKVHVYLYLATHENETQTIDEYIWSLGLEKNKIIEQFEHVLKENAIDCKLFYARNYYKKDKLKLKCSY